MYKEFCRLLEMYLKPVLNRNIIVYGSEGGDFLRWFLRKKYNKEIKTIIDRWDLSPVDTILHLWSLYYIYEENDIIINTTPQNIKDEFDDTGEKWQWTKYKDSQIINLWALLYENALYGNTKLPEFTYFGWLEYRYQADLLTAIKRKFVTGKNAHGYLPTDFRIFLDAFSDCVVTKNDAVLDIGCGKGSGVLSLLACGFHTIGAIEYTEKIYNIMLSNFNKMNISYIEHVPGKDTELVSQNINVYLGDASVMRRQLNDYNWFFLFNPFSMEIFEIVLNNICRSMEERSRKIHIFYAEPIAHSMIMDTGKFQIKQKICSNLSNVSYYSYIYESIN